MGDGNGLDQQADNIKALGVVATRLGTAATTTHETIVAVRPYAISMKWMPVLMLVNLVGILASNALLYAILLSLLKR